MKGKHSNVQNELISVRKQLDVLFSEILKETQEKDDYTQIQITQLFHQGIQKLEAHLNIPSTKTYGKRDYQIILEDISQLFDKLYLSENFGIEESDIVLQRCIHFYNEIKFM